MLFHVKTRLQRVDHCRAARTLCYYLSETNLNVHHWLMTYMQKYPIPRVTPLHACVAFLHLLFEFKGLTVSKPLVTTSCSD